MAATKFYEAFGKVANGFSWLEGDLRRLLAGLAFGGDFVIAATFLDSTQLRGNTRALRKFSRIHSDQEKTLLEIVTRIDKLGDRRNLFIHGLWTHATFDEPEGFALVRDLKTKFSRDDKERRWSSGQAEKVSMNDFRSMLLEIREVTFLIDSVVKELEEDLGLEFPGHTSHMSSVQFILDDSE